MILNITFMGESVEYDLGDIVLSDDEIRRIAVELVHVDTTSFEHYVVDRALDGRVYLRPKVPFGSGE